MDGPVALRLSVEIPPIAEGENKCLFFFQTQILLFSIRFPF